MELEVGAADTLSAVDVKAIVDKAVKAAVKVVSEELQKKIQDINDYIKHLEERVHALESDVSPLPDVSDLNQTKCSAIAERPRYRVRYRGRRDKTLMRGKMPLSHFRYKTVCERRITYRQH